MRIKRGRTITVQTIVNMEINNCGRRRVVFVWQGISNTSCVCDEAMLCGVGGRFQNRIDCLLTGRYVRHPKVYPARRIRLWRALCATSEVRRLLAELQKVFVDWLRQSVELLLPEGTAPRRTSELNRVILTRLPKPVNEVGRLLNERISERGKRCAPFSKRVAFGGLKRKSLEQAKSTTCSFPRVSTTSKTENHTCLGCFRGEKWR